MQGTLAPIWYKQNDQTMKKTSTRTYLTIAAEIRDSIQTGRARPGEPLPSARELAALESVHRHTVMAAYDELMAEGWIVSQERRGYFVSAALPSHFFEARDADKPAPPAKPYEWRLARTLDPPSERDSGSQRLAFQSGRPDVRAFPFRELSSHVADVLRHANLKTVDGGQTAGHPALLAELRRYLRRARGLQDRALIMTHGSQEALFIAAQLLVGPGDHAAVEALGYPPAWQALRAAGAQLVEIPVDADGMDPDALDRACKKRKIRVLYVTPLHQYPTTVTLPVARRLELYEIALRHGVPILEDDYDHEYHYSCQPLPPLAAADPAGLVVYLGTFTKVLYPAARLGYMAVPPGLAQDALRFRRVTSSQNDTVLQAALARWFKDGGFERHLRRMRRLYEERLTALVAGLEAGRERGLPLDWVTPDGGMALWLGLGRLSSARVAADAAEHGVFVHAEEHFRADGERGHHLRLGFAALRPAEIAQGLALLFKAL